MAAGTLDRAFGYQDNAMALPVADVAAAVPFYERVLGFRVASRAETPPRTILLERDGVQIGLTENGGDPTQDGCAFHVTNIDALFAEFKANGLSKDDPAFSIEKMDGENWKVFYVVAPDGLCYWFGERQERS
jgi:lactoylglutathione lyase